MLCAETLTLQPITQGIPVTANLTYKNRPWQVGIFSIFEFTFANANPTKNLKKVRLGIDLVNRGHEVRKLFMKHCAPMCLRARCDPEDVLQEVYKGILIRNSGTCPYDPAKSAFSTYVVMVASCVTTNYVNKNTKTASREYYGTDETQALEEPSVVKSQGSAPALSDDAEFEVTISQIKAQIDHTARGILDDLLDGYKVSALPQRHGIDNRRVSKYITQIKNLLISEGYGC